jgi:ATP-dependent DNA helicase RecG
MGEQKKNGGENEGENGGENGGEKLKLNATQRVVFIAIKENNQITIEQLTQKIGKTESTIERAIKVLKDKGLLERIGPAKGGHWLVKESK